MAKVIKVMEPFEQLSGKVCQHSKFIINLGRKGDNKGQMWTGKQCNGRDYTEHPLSADETKSQTRFKAVRLAVKAIKADPEDLAEAYEAYALVRDNYKSFTSYLWKTECEKWNLNHTGTGGGPEEE